MGGELQAKMTMSMTITGPDSESMIIYGKGIQNYRGVGDSFSNAITMWDSFFHPETANSNTCKHFNMRQSGGNPLPYHLQTAFPCQATSNESGDLQATIPDW